MKVSLKPFFLNLRIIQKHFFAFFFALLFTQFTYSQCTNCPSGSTYSGTVYASNNDLSGSHSCLAINGTYIVDENVAIAGSTIYMGPDAEIVVRNGALLDLNATSLQGCGVTMWKGIVVEPGGNLHSSDVEYFDAINAIDANMNSTITVKFCIFDKNYIGINFKAKKSKFPSVPNPISGVFLPEPINSNIFKCTSTLLPPHSGELSLAGVNVDMKAFISIGSSNWGQNEFAGMQHGIIAKRGTVRIQNADIHGVSGFNSPVGVKMSDHAAVGISDSDFDNCSGAVESTQSHLKIENCDFTNNTDAFSVMNITDSPSKNIIINNNTISGSQFSGIRVANAGTVSKLEIKDNQDIEMSGINFNDNSLFAIELSESVLIDQPNAVVENNIFTGSNLISAIVAGHLGKLKIINNQFETDRDVDPIVFFDVFGDIYLDECSEVEVIDNNLKMINGTDAPFPRTKGLYILNSGMTDIICNTTDGAEKGILFSGANSSTYMRDNTINDHTYGLFLDGPNSTSPSPLFGANTYIGEQGVEFLAHFNMWPGEYTSGASNGSESNIVDMSKFHIKDATSDELPPDIEAEDDWFFNDGLGDAIGCIDMEENLRGIDSSDIIIADGTIDFGDFHDGLFWRSEMQLFRKLRADTSLLGEEPVVDSFYNESVSSNISAFYDIEQSINGLYIPSASLIQQYEQASSGIDSHTLQIDIIDSLLLTALPAQQAQLRADRLAQLDSLDGFLETRAVLDSTILSDRVNLVGAIITANNAIVPTNTPEQNQQTVNDIYLKTLAKSILNLDSSQIVQLTSIADQCPMSGGPAVKGARTLLKLEFDTLSYNDSLECQLVKGREAKVYVGDSEAGFTVYPNPSNGELFINFDEVLKSDVRLNIYHSNGGLVYVGQLSAGQKKHSLNLQSLQSGLYVLQIIYEDRIVTKKIAVTK